MLSTISRIERPTGEKTTQKDAEFIPPGGKDTYLHVLQNETECIEQTKLCAAAVEESGTAEKIAEMISSAKQETKERSLMLSECCPKTKKQRQVLISQKLEKNLLGVDKVAVSFSDNAEAINLTTTGAVAENTGEKCKFAEVEIKLEEMFAGIDDEQSATASSKDSQQTSQAIACMPSTSNCELNAPKEKAVPTKGAIKSADLVPEVIDSIAIKNLSPRRRHSIANVSLMEKHNLLCNDKDGILKDGGVSTNNSSTASATGDITGNHTNMTKKNKSFGNKRKCFSEKKKGRIQNVKQRKKTIPKYEETSSKMKTLKFKNRRLQNSSVSESEHEQDEKTQQTLDAKYRSPYILIKNDGSISVVNTTTTDESSDKNSKTKRASFNVPERRNVRGIYSSTLSNKYDADTADSTWICVFCKRGPHKKGLGDLFGPYIINIDNDEFKNAQDVRDRNLAARSAKRNRNDGTHNNTSSPVGGQHKNEAVVVATADFSSIDEKRASAAHLLSGMSRMSSNSFEIWFHEDCAVWAPNLYIVGSRLVGLDSAVWQSTFHTCVCCMRSGAIICCLQRDCKETAHVPCARENNWHLNESKFWSHCAKHHLSNLDTCIKTQLLLDKIKFPC